MWKSVLQKPEKSGNYLVALCEDNSLEFNHKEPVIAQFGLYRRHPQSWTANDGMYHEQVIDKDVLWWMELPEVPKNPPFNVWLEWEYTEENPFPKLDGDPLMHVRFADSSESKDKPCGAQPISYWHGDGTNDGNSLNNFYQGYSEDELLYETQIIAYMLVDPNNHD